MIKHLASTKPWLCSLALPLVSLSLGVLPTHAASSTRPNVIIILADDMGYGDVGCTGSKDMLTPNIDSIAQHGIRFANGYVSQPLSSPSRAGLLTGRYQQRFGHEMNPAYQPDDPNLGLPLDQVTIAQVMRDAGYATGAVGKWHLGAAPCFHPNARGFSEYFGFLGGGHVYFPYTSGDELHKQYISHVMKNSLFGEYLRPILRNDKPVELTEYMTDTLSKEAASFILRHKSEPFFLYLAYNAVHSPLEAPDNYVSRFPNITDKRRRTYAGMTAAMDDGIGRVLKTLRENGLEENTIVWFLSDNGGPVYTEMPTCNAPFRGYKHQVYEGGIHLPFLVQWPGHLPQGKVFENPVISLDIFPTVAAAGEAKVPEKVKLDGVNLLPYLTDKVQTPPHDILHWRSLAGGPIWAIREGQYKLVGSNKKVELFDLKSDLSETTDLSKDKPDLVTHLQKLHTEWNATLKQPLWQMPKKVEPAYFGSVEFRDMEAAE